MAHLIFSSSHSLVMSGRACFLSWPAHMRMPQFRRCALRIAHCACPTCGATIAGVGSALAWSACLPPTLALAAAAR